MHAGMQSRVLRRPPPCTATGGLSFGWEGCWRDRRARPPTAVCCLNRVVATVPLPVPEVMTPAVPRLSWVNPPCLAGRADQTQQAQQTRPKVIANAPRSGRTESDLSGHCSGSEMR